MAKPEASDEEAVAQPIPFPMYVDLLLFFVGRLKTIVFRYGTSAPFKFIVGPRKIEFTIHSTLVAKQSPKLNALVTNGMKESVEQCAHWEDEDAETFQRFAEFVYSGKYAVDSPRKRGSDSAAGTKRKLPEDPYRESLSYGRRLWRDNISEGFEKMHAAPPLDATPSRTRPEEDYTPVFLAHAKMYVFADYHDIKALRTLSLQYLRRLLTVFELISPSQDTDFQCF